MFALQSLINRQGAQCKEYYQPSVTTGHFPGVVFANLLKSSPAACGAKTYDTEADAQADIPNWIELASQDAQAHGRNFNKEYFASTITVVPA